MCAWYAETADNAAAMLVGDDRYLIDAPPTEGIDAAPFDTAEEALRWFEAERHNLMTVTRLAVTSNRLDHALVLALRFCTICMTYLDFDDWDVMSTVALRAAASAERGSDRALAIRNRGVYHFRRGDYGRARVRLTEALALYEEIGDLIGAGKTVNILGLLELRVHNLARAAERFTAAGHIASESGNHHLSRAVEMNLANVQIEEDDNEPAILVLPGIIAYCHRVGDHAMYTNALNRLAEALRQHGDLPGAKRAMDEALASAEERRAKVEEGALLLEAPRIQLALGDVAAALESCQLAAALQRQLGDRSREMLALTNTGRVMEQVGRFEEALSFYLQAADQFSELEEAWNEACARVGAADAAARLDRIDTERAQLERAACCLEGFSDPKAIELQRQVDERLG